MPAPAPRQEVPCWPHATSASAKCDSLPPSTSLIATYVVMRHGDRSPGANVFRGHDEEHEGDREYWSREVLGKEEIDALQRSFPASEGGGNCSSKWPYGRLTARGAEQAFRFGAHLRAIYGSDLAESAAAAAAPGRAPVASDAMTSRTAKVSTRGAAGFECSRRTVTAQATDFSRTVRTAQAMLCGLCGMRDWREVEGKGAGDGARSLAAAAAAEPRVEVLVEERAEDAVVPNFHTWNNVSAEYTQTHTHTER